MAGIGGMRYFSFSFRESWLRYLLLVGLALFLLFPAWLSISTLDYILDRPRIAEELIGYRHWLHGTGEYEKPPAIKIYAADNRLIGQYLPQRGSWLTVNSCEKMVWLRKAAVAAEDRRFYEHGGFSLRDMLRALRNNLLSLRIREGGGSITQQLARNLFTDRERSLYRKLYETYAALQIESLLAKEEILCLYLNKIYMGEGRIGAEEASWFYFKKSPEKLTPAEAALVVGLFPSPVNYSPLNNLALSLKKQRQVLESMVEMGYLDSERRWRELSRFLRRYGISEQDPQDAGKVGLYGASRDFLYNAAPTANQYVKSFLYKNLREKQIQAGGLKVYTSIDSVRQRVASQVLRSFVQRERERLLTRNRRADPELLEQLARRLNGAFISLDTENGDIQAVVGGYDVAEGAANQRVWNMKRQPGSSIKGFLYAVALEEELLEPDMEVFDEPVDIGGYKPRNWNKSYLGPVSLRQAVAMSINTVAVRTLNELGVSTFRGYMRAALELGYREASRRFKGDLTLALGSGEISPIELAMLYAPLGNGGYLLQPELVKRVESSSGRLLWRSGRNSAAEGRRLFSRRTTIDALQLMGGVFEPDLQGTAAFIGRRRNSNSDYLPFQIAGKTGSVQIVSNTRRKFPNVAGYKDAWFVGIAPGEVDIVWFGQDEGAPIKAGGGSAAAAWAQYAQRALKGRIESSFAPADPFIESFWEQEYGFSPQDIDQEQKPPHEYEDFSNSAPSDSASFELQQSAAPLEGAGGQEAGADSLEGTGGQEQAGADSLEESGDREAGIDEGRGEERDNLQAGAPAAPADSGGADGDAPGSDALGSDALGGDAP